MVKLFTGQGFGRPTYLPTAQGDVTKVSDDPRIEALVEATRQKDARAAQEAENGQAILAERNSTAPVEIDVTATT